MQYIRVTWARPLPDAPKWVCSEVDDNRRELRRVEIWEDGRRGFACNEFKSESTSLSREPVPSLDAFITSPRLRASALTRDEFESVWREAVLGSELN